jgi:hypothetical protein
MAKYYQSINEQIGGEDRIFVDEYLKLVLGYYSIYILYPAYCVTRQNANAFETYM